LRRLALTIIVLLFLGSTDSGAQTNERRSTVGYPAKIESIIVPGPQLVAKPIEDRREPLILRILNTFPHGDGFRYDVEYYGLDPGQYDLADYFQYEDGSTPTNLPAIIVQIDPVRPVGEMPLPNQLKTQRIGFRNFYLSGLLVGGVLWLIGLAAILFWGRGTTRRRQHMDPKLTVADRLEPLVARAILGQLDARGQAELERLLELFWRKKLRVNDLPAKEFRARLRQHPQASEMLRHLDAWLHRPGESQDVDLTLLLEPYQQLKDEEL
jgi:hypothetical protein